MFIAVEGIHGCGKSTLIECLVKKMESLGLEVEQTRWNSYELVHPAIYHLRKNRLLNNPNVYFMMQLSDFAFRHDQEILPALSSGKVVIADRYVHTGIVRGLVRGLSMDYVENAYSFALKPDIVILLDMPAKESLKRTVPNSNSTWYIGFGNAHVSENTFDIEGYSAYLESSRQLYLQLAKNDLVLNANISTNEILKTVLEQKIIKEGIYKKCSKREFD